MFDEPKDLFEEKAPPNLPVGVPKPAIAQLPVPMPELELPPVASAPALRSGKKRLLIVVVVLLILAIAGTLSWFLLSRVSTTAVTTTPTSSGATSKTTTTEKPAAPKVETKKAEVTVVDSDGDGLSDAEELQLGTNPNLSDTDVDGLGDREEVKVYSTDPLNPDTDGDGYLDGAEVSKGYNPNGAGKLFQVP